MNPVFSVLKTTIFEEMSGLARQHGAANLGQGFPDDPGPEDVRRRAAEAVMEGSNQYPPMAGLPELRAAVADHYTRFQGVQLDPTTEVFVTSGATEALTCAILGLVRPGDEVVLFQPTYDSYLPMVRLAGGVPRLITLQPPEWRITREALEAVVGDRTRLLIFNNPHNPTARVFDDQERALIAEVCVRHDILALTDEVWEHLTFDGHAFRPLMLEDGMRERTVKVGSAGKIFSMTGWKVGWVCAAPPLAAQLLKAHQFFTFTTPPNLQTAVAYGLGKDAVYFDGMRAQYGRGRERLTRGLEAEGFSVLPSQGTYFLNLDLAASDVAMPDREFCLRAVAECGVAAIPLSALCDSDPVTTAIRLCFAKRDETIDAGVEGLARARRLFA